jgi:transposase
MFQQGLNIKTSSIITDEHVQSFLLSHLRLMKDEDRTPEKFRDMCNHELFSKISNAPESISIKTSCRWMKFLGFKLKSMTKGYYTDGHNREDVAEYRDEVFLPRMLEYERRMEDYTGEDMSTVIAPELREGEKRVVLITHDESTFYCCEGKPMLWMENGKNKLLPKTKGTSIMASGFVCPCHGMFRDDTRQSFQLFEAGKNREGWFTNKDIVAQFEPLVPLIKSLHPDCEIVIAFDNSMTHHAKVPDGLDVTNLKMSDGRAARTNVDMKSGWYIKDGQRIEQSMQFEDGRQKGCKTILFERGKHKNDQGHDLLFQCNFCRSKISDRERAEGISEGWLSHKCCLSYVLSNEEDFLAQEEWLTEVVHEAGFSIIFYPKYHCELNFIEMIWGWVKSHHRRHCTYNYKDLKDSLPNTFLQLLPLSFVKKTYQHCLRFMSGYRQKLEGPLLDYAMRKYTSHRVVPIGITEELTKEYEKYLAKKKR